MANRSKLQRFSVLHPTADLAIVRSTAQDYLCSMLIESENPVQVIWQTRVIADYSRRRDAWRALKACGYRQEGCFWRLMPASVQPPSAVSIEVSDLVGDL